MTEKQIIELEKIEAVKNNDLEFVNNFNPIIEEVKKDYRLLLLSGFYSIINLSPDKELEYLEKCRIANNPDYKQERSA